MACVTSYFNSTLWHKSMHRFWPLWTVYLVGWLFLIPFLTLQQYFSYLSWVSDGELPIRLLRLALNAPEMLQPGVWLAAGYGLLCAMAVFGYLYNNRSACMMHALPVDRTSLFCSQYAAGVSYFLLPHLAAAALGMVVYLVILPSNLWYAAAQSLLTWFLVQTAACLFFFSFAVFCAMFTGHAFALPAFYGILNILVYALYELIASLMGEFFYGFARNFTDSDFLLKYFTPIYGLVDASEWIVKHEQIPGSISSPIQWYLADPGKVAVFAAAAVVFAVAALLVYRTRHIESAGDVVSVRIVRPIFRSGVAFCTGLTFGVGVALFFDWLFVTPLLILCVILCTAIGWFAAEMLLRKSFRVLKAWKGCLVMMLAMAVLCVAFVNDWFGVEDKVPSVGEVEYVYVSVDTGAPYDSGTHLSMEFTDPARIQTFIELHRAILAEKHRAPAHNNYRAESGDGHVYVTLNYTLTNGSTLKRNYRAVPLFADELGQPDTVSGQLQQLVNDRELVALAYGLDNVKSLRPVEVSLQDVYDRTDGRHTLLVLERATGEDLRALWQAVQADFAEGTLGKRYLIENEERYNNTYLTDLHITFAMDRTEGILPGEYASSQIADEAYYKYETRGFTVTLTPHARHTLKWLEDMDVLGDRFCLAPHNADPSEPQYKDPYYAPIPEGATFDQIIAGAF